MNGNYYMYVSRIFKKSVTVYLMNARVKYIGVKASSHLPTLRCLYAPTVNLQKEKGNACHEKRLPWEVPVMDIAAAIRMRPLYTCIRKNEMSAIECVPWRVRAMESACHGDSYSYPYALGHLQALV
jgi:hypothetical protein